MSREGIFNRCQREPKERQETRTKRIREFDVRRTKNLLLYLRKPSPDGCFARTCGRSLSVRACQILAQSFQAFRDVFPRERFPRFRVARIRSDFVPGARVRIAHSREETLVVSFRARGKKTSGKTVLLLCCFRVWRERRACTVPLCARHVDIIFPYEVAHIGNRTFFSTFVTHRNTHKHT